MRGQVGARLPLGSRPPHQWAASKGDALEDDVQVPLRAQLLNEHLRAVVPAVDLHDPVAQLDGRGGVLRVPLAEQAVRVDAGQQQRLAVVAGAGPEAELLPVGGLQVHHAARCGDRREGFVRQLPAPRARPRRPTDVPRLHAQPGPGLVHAHEQPLAAPAAADDVAVAAVEDRVLPREALEYDARAVGRLPVRGRGQVHHPVRLAGRKAAAALT
mmetsp:Transcript_18754/g.58967  ORF Transcript_18754/g.58967 Transcript_18754/m.58967 type:complete len:214 (-) Transcript_18754:130-771(-)